MTRADGDKVIQALEICQSSETCAVCPYNGYCPNEFARDTLALIRLLMARLKMQGTLTESRPQEHDPVNHPSHYTQGGVECIEAIKAACTGLDGYEGYCTGNAIKYLWRWKHKNGAEDLRKASWYLGALLGAKEAEDEGVH